MSFSEGLGYLASLLVFTTFYMKTMAALRLLAIASNFAFIGYGFLETLYPVLLLHLALLPMNVHRLVQIRKTMPRSHASGNRAAHPGSPTPRAARMRLNRGEVLCRKGDPIDALYYVAKGTIALSEDESSVRDGNMIGLAGLLSPGGVHPSTAVCDTECEVYALSRAGIRELLEAAPEAASAFSQVIISELDERRGRDRDHRAGERGVPDRASPDPGQEPVSWHPRQQWMH